MRKRGTESADNPREAKPVLSERREAPRVEGPELEAPSEGWLLRTLAELRREQRYGATPVARPKTKGRRVGS